MTEHVINLTLDINCQKSVTRLFMGQYDIGRKAEVTVTADGEPYSCENCTVVCQGVRGNRTHFAFDCEVNSAGHIITTFDEILKSSGIAYAKFVISDSTHSYSTEKIIIDCENALIGNIVNVNDYVILNQLIERLHALSESGAVLVDTELSENSSNPIANYVIASIIYKLIETKADTIKLLPACEGAMTFTPYSNFILGQVGSTSGTYNPDIKYRVTSEDIMKFDYDLNVSVDDGFTGYVVKYADGTYESIKSLSDTNGYVIPANTEFRLHIRRNPENTAETANINEFVNAVKFQTKIALEISKTHSEMSEINSELKATKAEVISGFDGALTFALCSNFVRANAKSTDGSLDTNVKYRVTSEDIMKFDYDLNISVDDGFTAYVVKFINGKYDSIKSLSDTNGYVIPANTEFRLHIRRKTENTAETANISEFVSAVNFRTKIAAEVANVDSRVKVVEDIIDNIPDNNTIPDYYYADSYLPDKINEIKQNCNILNGITFAFVTDMHFKVNQRQSKKLLKKIMDETNVPFVLCGGDIVYLVGTEEELYEQITDFNEFKSCIGKDRLFCTRGNHDLYNATIIDPETREEHKLTTADVYDTLFRDTETKVSSMSVDNGCYCIDNEPQKTRIIMLNTTDVSGDFDYEGGGVSFRSGTLQWLSAALTEKTDYKIIIVCHTPLNYETFTNDVNSGENRDGLSLMVQAFKNKTEFETTRFGTTVQADFRNNTNELICVISGHRHIDGNSVENNVLNIVTTCDCIDKKDGYGRKAGTISEQAFDVFCINYDTNTIRTVRIGAGESREFNYSGVVGLCVDYENGTFERLESAVGLSAGEDFDGFSMYGGRKRCNVSDDGTITAYYGDENYAEDGSNGQVMVYQPKFYYKVVPLVLDKNTDSNIGYHLRKANYYVSGAPKSGFKLHPAFYDENGNEVDYILFSAYEGSMYDASAEGYVNDSIDESIAYATGDLLCSIAGKKPISGLRSGMGTKANFEAMANNRGSGWHLETIKATSANQLLMIIELGTMNTQTAIGRGVVSISDNSAYNCASLTGSTASIGNGTGQATKTTNEIGGTETAYTASGKLAVTYRGVENPWGNIWKHIQGVNIWGNGSMGGGQPYIANNFTFNEFKNSDNYEPVGFTLPNVNGYINAMGYGGEDFDWLLMPSEIGGTSTLPVGDYLYVTPNLNGYRIAQLGGCWSYGADAGGFCWALSASVGGRRRSVGGRLLYVPSAVK